MSKGNSDSELVRSIEEARALLDKALSLAKGGRTQEQAPKRVEPKKGASAEGYAEEFDFSMPVRAFMKKHHSGKSGAKKFTLLIAYLVKGDTQKSVPLDEVLKHWNSLTAFLGTYNAAHSVRARENDWVHSNEGSYLLRPSWMDAF